MFGFEGESDELDTEMQRTPPVLLPPRRGAWCQRPHVRMTGYAVLVGLLLFTVVATTRITLIRDRTERRRFWWDTLGLIGHCQSKSSKLKRMFGMGHSSDFGGEQQCSNSRQGRDWVVDDRGRVCKQGQQDNPSGCCPAMQQSGRGNASVVVKTSQFACDGCIAATGCCSVYEVCVACCMGPDAAAPLKASLARTGVAWSSPSDIDAAAAARFPLCLALCRTSSRSVMRQRFYKSATHRHCWLPD